MKLKTNYLLNAVKVLAWIIFIGICIKTGAMLTSFLVSMFVNPVAAGKLYPGLDLSELKAYSGPHYVGLMVSIIFINGLKAHLFLMVIQMLQKINIVHPFSKEVGTIITRLGFFSLGIGLFSIVIGKYMEWLSGKGVTFQDLTGFMGGGAEFLLLGGIIYFISLVFEKGIELQTENQLTV